MSEFHTDFHHLYSHIQNHRQVMERPGHQTEKAELWYMYYQGV